MAMAQTQLEKKYLKKPWSAMGTALKNFTQVVVASKIFNFEKFLAEENNRTVIELYRKASLFRNITSLIRTFDCNLRINDRSEVELHKENSILILNTQMRTKEILKLFYVSENTESYQRITKIASKINYSPEEMFTLIRRLCKHEKHAAFEKNYLYQTFMNCYL